ncbi:protein phosphatase Slingshot homolog 2b isoform X2 [Brachionichthys hirsutus]|uniref:protein phosphatase Slingshot homolog 2b isoform X2 n=1 Tax=Brachionichthys hirsutus TaxID=412623 RepID=UPI00360456F6
MALVTVQRSPTPSTSSSPCVSESGSGEDDRRSQPRSISESFLTVKGAALFLPRGNGSTTSSASRFPQLRSKHAGDIQQHLQTMFTLLRPEDNIKLAVRLESIHGQIIRYMVVVSTNGRQDTEESIVLGMDFSPRDSSCSVGLVLPLWSDTLIHLDGDGGFSVSTDSRVHVFKPVSVQAMWSALQSLHKACEVARCHNYYPGSLFLTWVSYYQSRVCSDQARINEWNAMQDVQSHRADSPVLFSDIPTERELTERQIKTSLKEIMMQKDLENVTSKEIRTELEMHMTCNLRAFREFIDNEMIVILGQMDSPTEIFDHVFLGSEWNASNLEELQNSGVQYILNVTREIDNFFPGVFEYHNIRVYDEEATDLLAYWNDTYKFISRAKKSGSKCLVHCKMGISRSAATVIAYAMKEYGWDLKRAFDYVKERRAVTKPNRSFMRQLEEYQGILLASRQRHNKLWRSLSDSDLSERHEPLSTSARPLSLGRSNPHGQVSSMPCSSVKELLESLGTSASTGKPTHSTSQPDTGTQIRSPNQLSPSYSRGAEPQSLEAPCPEPAAAPVSRLSPPLPNGLGDSEEQPSSLPLSLPTAAALVPELQRTDIVAVAQSVLLGQPHPPPSFRRPPPAPSPPPDCTDGVIKPRTLSCSLPEMKATPSSAPEPVTTPSARPAGGRSPSAPPPVEKTDCHQQMGGVSTKGLAVQSPPTSNCIGFPSAVPQDQVFCNSVDHIDFFNAREKFKGMSQDGRNCQLKECNKEQQQQQQQQQQPPSQETCAGGGGAEEKTKEMTVPAEDAGLGTASARRQSLPQGLQDQDSRKLGQEVDVRDVLLRVEAKNVKEDVRHKEEEEELAPVGLCSDWRRGSVRRVKQQLEERMKRNNKTPSSPPSLCGSSLCSLQQPPSLHPGKVSDPQEAPASLQASAASSVREKQRDDDGTTNIEPVEADARPQGNNDGSAGGQKLRPADARRVSPSALNRSASVNFLCLEGVTEVESSTDWDLLPEGLHGELIMRETLETLCELGAFLQQVSMGVPRKTRCVDQAFDPYARTPLKQGGRVRQRARAVEARIRQAGLTPPSQMKRSASLAKLGCLELLANDLSEWEFSRCSVAPSSAESPFHVVSDESKKQRVDSSPPSQDQRPEGRGAAAESLVEDAQGSPPPTPPPTPPLSPPTDEGRRGERLHTSDQDSPGPTLQTTRQQYGRTHPLRQLKKRTASPLYNTM